MGKHLPFLPNPCPSISSSPGSGNLPLKSLHLLRRSSIANHPTEPDLQPCHSILAEQHSLSEPNPCGNPSPSDTPSQDGVPLPGGHPEGVSNPGTTECGTPSDRVENPKPTLRLSLVLKPARIRSTPTPSDAKPSLPGSRTKSRCVVPLGGGIKPTSPISSNLSMKILMWNCRGAACPHFHCHFADMVREHHPNFAIIMETRIAGPVQKDSVRNWVSQTLSWLTLWVLLGASGSFGMTISFDVIYWVVPVKKSMLLFRYTLTTLLICHLC